MSNYYQSINEDPFDYLPVTFHVKTGVDDPEFQRFKAYQAELIEKRAQEEAEGGKPQRDIWIIKPGEDTNRGDGIDVAEEYEDIERLVNEGTEK